MRAPTIARVYAETLLRLAERDDALDAVAASATEFFALYARDARLRRFLTAPQIAAADKQALLEQAFAGRLHPALRKFLFLVVAKHREPLLDEIRIAWQTRLDTRAHRQTAQVTTAVPADGETLDRIRAVLETRTGRTIVLEEAVEPALLGGLVIRLGDTLIDGSLRTRLATLRHRLTARARAGHA